MEYWEELDLEKYNRITEGTPVRRAKYEKFRDNVDAVIENLKKR
jgi:epoxyqueuosine reductase